MKKMEKHETLELAEREIDRLIQEIHDRDRQISRLGAATDDAGAAAAECRKLEQKLRDKDRKIAELSAVIHDADAAIDDCRRIVDSVICHVCTQHVPAQPDGTYILRVPRRLVDGTVTPEASADGNDVMFRVTAPIRP